MNTSLLPKEEIPMVYLSPNKVKAFEDCINFAPGLFRLSKSIVISEPIMSFMDHLQSRFGASHYRSSPLTQLTVG